jgi:hypothetical protein
VNAVAFKLAMAFLIDSLIKNAQKISFPDNAGKNALSINTKQ